MSARWRELGGQGEPYPAWVRELRHKSGVYAIRRKAGILTAPRVLYVGESHTSRLYDTLTRHFQVWRRGKSWWVGMFAEAQTDPGHTYDRGRCEVLVQVATPARALTLQDGWIRKYEPTDNRAGVPVPPADDTPF